MTFLISFLVSLAISAVMTVISMLLTPQASTSTKSNVSPGELDGPTASEGIPIPHIRGTRFVPVNCIWWQSEGNEEVKR